MRNNLPLCRNWTFLYPTKFPDFVRLFTFRPIPRYLFSRGLRSLCPPIRDGAIGSLCVLLLHVRRLARMIASCFRHSCPFAIHRAPLGIPHWACHARSLLLPNRSIDLNSSTVSTSHRIRIELFERVRAIPCVLRAFDVKHLIFYSEPKAPVDRSITSVE
jgi:hypothetical protein